MIFSYELLDAWMEPISEVKIYQKDKNNVECSKGKIKIFKTLPLETISKIIKIIESNQDVFKIKCIKDCAIFDGSINNFYFATEYKKILIKTYNFWAWNEKEYQKIISNNIILLQNIFNEISKVLIYEGISKDYFALNY